MKLLVALLFATTLLGCTHPDSPFAVWQEIPSGDRISLTPEFTRSLRATVASSGSLKPRTDPPMPMAPEGIIEIDRLQYDFYPGVIERNGHIWSSPELSEFFRCSGDYQKFVPASASNARSTDE
ncbi:hypothetical protein SH528x_002811 [Novipirellula sp. SH528]|uniref:hypothetical protein n=1 Tax=Novipirellula sp. SH528 TaxID=3454466 RepID=UPI003FA10CBD